MKAAPIAEDEIFIAAGSMGKNYWIDLWRYRELFLILAWRDVAVRYRQTVAGAAWVIVQPLLSMIIMTIIFGKVAGLPSEGGVPYAVMVFAALLPWQFFANTLSSVGQSIVGNSVLISKVYFPRMIIPASSVVVSLVDFLFASSILAGLMVWYRFLPSWRLLTLPFFIFLAILAALGPGLIISALIVRYRDFRFVNPFIIQIGLYATPVAYSSAVIQEKISARWFALYSLNPLVGVIDGFRWAILNAHSTLSLSGCLKSLLLTSIVFVCGIQYFRKTEREFADVI